MKKEYNRIIVGIRIVVWRKILPIANVAGGGRGLSNLVLCVADTTPYKP
jgi:hypothetical protein